MVFNWDPKLLNIKKINTRKSIFKSLLNFKSKWTWLLLRLLPCPITAALWLLCSVKSPDFLMPLVLANPKSQQQLNVLRLFTTQATWIADRFGAALMSTPGKGSHGEVIGEEKSCHLQDLHGSPSGQGHLLGQSLPARNKDGHGVFVFSPWDRPPWGSLRDKPPLWGCLTLSPGGPAGPGGPMGPTLP